MIKKFGVIDIFFDVFPDFLGSVVIGEVFIIDQFASTAEAALYCVKEVFAGCAG